MRLRFRCLLGPKRRTGTSHHKFNTIKTCNTLMRWVKYIDHLQLYSSIVNALWSTLLLQEEDDVYLEPTEGKLHQTSGEPSLIMKIRDQHFPQLLHMLWKTIPFLSLTISLQSCSSRADEDPSVSTDTLRGVCTHVSAFILVPPVCVDTD